VVVSGMFVEGVLAGYVLNSVLTYANDIFFRRKCVCDKREETQEEEDEWFEADGYEFPESNLKACKPHQPRYRTVTT